MKERVALEVDAALWAKENPARAAKVIARALATCTTDVTSDWLLSLCRSEGFK